MIDLMTYELTFVTVIEHKILVDLHNLVQKRTKVDPWVDVYV